MEETDMAGLVGGAGWECVACAPEELKCAYTYIVAGAPRELLEAKKKSFSCPFKGLALRRGGKGRKKAGKYPTIHASHLHYSFM
jgi:hypothetical protein